MLAEMRVSYSPSDAMSVITAFIRLALTGGAPGGFTVTTFRLTDRRDSTCDGAGNTARTAILVRDGRIVEWYRLPDDPNAPGLQPPPLDDVEAATV